MRLVAALAEGIPIFYGNTVKRISYRPQGVVVTVKGDTVYKADACLCTVPLGVLKVRARVSLLSCGEGLLRSRASFTEVSSAAPMYDGACNHLLVLFCRKEPSNSTRLCQSASSRQSRR